MEASSRNSFQIAPDHGLGTRKLKRAAHGRVCEIDPVVAAMRSLFRAAARATLDDHSCGDGLVGAWIDEDKGTGEAVAAVGVVKERCCGSQ